MCCYTTIGDKDFFLTPQLWLVNGCLAGKCKGIQPWEWQHYIVHQTCITLLHFQWHCRWKASGDTTELNQSANEMGPYGFHKNCVAYMHHVSTLHNRGNIHCTYEDLVRGKKELALHRDGLIVNERETLGKFLVASTVLLMDANCAAHWANYSGSRKDPPGTDICSMTSSSIASQFSKPIQWLAGRLLVRSQPT